MPLWQGLFGWPDTEKMEAAGDIDGLVKALSDKKRPAVRRKAAESLGRIGQIRALEPLLAALKDADQEVCEAAVEALGQMGAPAAEQLMDATTMAYALAMYRGQREELAVHKGALKALVQIGAPAAEPLVGALKDEAAGRFPMEGVAGEALVQIGAPAVEALLGALHDSEPAVRRAVIRVLADIADPRALEPLMKALGEFMPLGTHEAIVRALAQIGDVRAVKPLLSATGPSFSPDVIVAASDTLVQLGAPAVEPLVAALKEGEEHARGWAAWALGEIGDARAVEPLLAELETAPATVRFGDAPASRVPSAAAEALGKIGDPRAVEPLVVALGKWTTYKEAAAALVQMGAPAVKPLLAALGGLTREFRAFGVNTLEQLVTRIDEPLRAEIADDVSNLSVRILLILYDASPQGEGFLTHSREAEPVRQIGRILSEVGGFHLMREIHTHFAGLRPGAARNLEMVWDGIGGWLG